MIQISLTTALVLYSAVLGFLMLMIWVLAEVSTRRTHRVHEQQFLWRCVFCGYVYLDETAEALSQCPRCRNYSSAEDKNARFIPSRPTLAPVETVPSGTDGESRNTSRRKRPHQRRRGPRRR
jgi:hypothetical protein